jgi:hypothetical protein
MVGDSYNKWTNKSIQFRRFSKDLDRDIISHPGGDHNLFKIEPVTFEGFSPVVLNKDSDSLNIGQNVTAVGYGVNHTNFSDDTPWEDVAFPGEAFEATLQVENDVSETKLSAVASGAGPCRGAKCASYAKQMSQYSPGTHRSGLRDLFVQETLEYLCWIAIGLLLELAHITVSGLARTS